jgi:transcriptional regulator GlxA family with amidase domain
MTHRIAVLLFERFSNHCLANAVEPLRAANSFMGKAAYEWEFVTLDGKQITSSSGLPVAPSKKLSDIDRIEDVFILSSYDYSQHANLNTSRALRAISSKINRFVGMDTGAWLLAEAGLLDGKSATIHWDVLDEMAEQFPDVNVLEDRFILDDGVATTGGVSTTFDFILDMVAKQLGTMLRLEVAAFFRHGNRSRLSDPLLRLTGQQKVDAAIAHMRRNIETPLSINDIAYKMQIHPKELNLLFHQIINAPPGHIYKRIRLREAKRLIEMSRLSISEIAFRIGYQNHASFTRAFKQEFKVEPRSIRDNAAYLF